MANLTFPQLSTGAQAQYPFRRRRIIQSPINSFRDGSIIASGIDDNIRSIWDLTYTGLTAQDQAMLQSFVALCRGPLLPFTFIDPTDNMLSHSENLGLGSWSVDPLLSVTPGALGPTGANDAFLVVNNGQTSQTVRQVLPVPASFQYCFSLYAYAPSMTTFALSTSSPSSSQLKKFTVGPKWQRFANCGRLSDNEMGITASIAIPVAQTVTIFGPQLEPQLSPSQYRATSSRAGVYVNAHLANDALTFQAQSSGLFSTYLSIETT